MNHYCGLWYITWVIKIVKKWKEPKVYYRQSSMLLSDANKTKEAIACKSQTSQQALLLRHVKAEHLHLLHMNWLQIATYKWCLTIERVGLWTYRMVKRTDLQLFNPCFFGFASIWKQHVKLDSCFFLLFSKSCAYVSVGFLLKI